MACRQRKTALCALLFVLFAAPKIPAQEAASADDDETVLQTIVVTAQRRAIGILDQSGNTAMLERDTLDRIGAKHVHEIFTAIPGTWISRGSGQEHLTAIRSPVLTGAGSCGAFLMLEDGIPIRPSGFCNVNQLFEILTTAAQQVEVIRGPGNALYGSNALHGTLNFLMPTLDSLWNSAAIEVGANQYSRVSASVSDAEATGLIAALEHDGGFRDDTGFRQGKMHARWRRSLAGGDLTTALSLTRLDQETAGFIEGEDAYLDPDLNRSNPNPEAFRNAESARLYAIWQGQIAGVDADIRPFIRYSDMQFLQHFLPGQPLEDNGHYSAGMNGLLTFEIGSALLQAGADFEWSDVDLVERQAAPAIGSPFLVATRPVGLHYDFNVTSVSAAPYLQWRVALSPTFELTAGLRAEWMRYDYDNRMLDGNTRDDGTACGFGGCLYTRPSDRKDQFFNVAPNLSVLWSISEQAIGFAQLSRGFRAPQMTELYRLQSGQSVSDLESEKLDQFELGWRFQAENTSAEIVAFIAKKRDSVLRDSEGFNVSRGRSLHRGIELQLRHRLTESLELAAAATLAKHSYDFNLDAARGELFREGNDVDTAPRRIGSLSLVWMASQQTRVSADWNWLSEYFLDAENQHQYPGHDLVNLTVEQQLSQSFILRVRARNVMDRTVADRADFAFGDYRYFPGRGREFFLELAYRP